MTDKIDDGGLVYPSPEIGRYEGITRRNCLADKAMIVMLGALITVAKDLESVEDKLFAIHEFSYVYADRQIAEGRKGEE